MMPSNYFDKTTDQVCQSMCFAMFRFCWEWVVNNFGYSVSSGSRHNPSPAGMWHGNTSVILCSKFGGLMPYCKHVGIWMHISKIWLSYFNAGISFQNMAETMSKTLKRYHNSGIICHKLEKLLLEMAGRTSQSWSKFWTSATMKS